MAQLDTSFYSVRPKSVEDYNAEADAAESRKLGAQSNRLALALQGRQMAQMERADRDDADLRAALSGARTQDDVVGILRGKGRYKEAGEQETAALTRKKTQTEISAGALKQAEDAAKYYNEAIGRVASPQDAEAFVLAIDKDPTFGPLLRNMGPIEARLARIREAAATPEGFKNWQVQTSTGLAKMIEMARQQKELDLRTANEVMTPDGKGGFVANRPLIAAKAEVARAGAASGPVTYGTPMPGTDAQGNPVYFQPSKGGGAPAIVPGVRPPAKDPALGQPTEDERKSAGYAIRMEGALKKLDEVGRKNPEALRPGVGTSIINMAPEGVANYARTPARQRVETAQLDALDAALTLATGAAYTKEQLKGLSRSYFAQPGDDDATIRDKEQRLAEIIETARIRAGRAAPSIDKMDAARGTGAAPRTPMGPGRPASPAQPAPAAPGVSGFKYLGTER